MRTSTMGNSDDEDMFQVQPLPAEELPSDYHKCFLYQWHCAVCDATAHLRDHVLLPLDPRSNDSAHVFADVHTGARLPAWHCPFQICRPGDRLAPCTTTATPRSQNRMSSRPYAEDLRARVRLHHGAALRGIAKHIATRRMWSLLRTFMHAVGMFFFFVREP